MTLLKGLKKTKTEIKKKTIKTFKQKQQQQQQKLLHLKSSFLITSAGIEVIEFTQIRFSSEI